MSQGSERRQSGEKLNIVHLHILAAVMTRNELADGQVSLLVPDLNCFGFFFSSTVLFSPFKLMLRCAKGGWRQKGADATWRWS